MSGSLLLLTGWILVALVLAVLFAYRLFLRRSDRQYIGAGASYTTRLHALLRNRITLVDHWSAPLKLIISLYTLFLAYLLYESFELIMRTVLQLLSYLFQLLSYL